jgi:hypothetical protein
MANSHELAERLAGLASRVNDLAVESTGPAARSLLRLQDRLTDLALQAIVLALDEEEARYKKAVNALAAAIDQIDDETESVEQVARVITLARKAADLAEAVIKAAA